jgi:putative membrane protein
MKMKSFYALTILLTALATTACRSGADAQVAAAVAETSMASTGGAGMNTLTDADAGAVARTINDGEIQLSQLGLTNGSSQQVRDFAQMMVADHTSANAQLLSNGYGMTENAVSGVLNAQVNRMMTRLRGLSGAEFDREFMSSQIALHQTALETMRTTLQPSAKEQNLRQTLTMMRNSVEMHLQQARTIQGVIGR